MRNIIRNFKAGVGVTSLTLTRHVASNKMAEDRTNEEQAEGSLVLRIATELFSSPLNLALLAICGFLIYKIFASRRSADTVPAREPELPPLKKQDFTLEQLKEYDGKGSDGRVLIAVNGKVFDVTRGKRFYGPGEFTMSS